MTTHRRVWALRAGVVLALVAGVVGVAGGSPAFADPGVTVKITGMSTTTISKGGSSTINYTVSPPATANGPTKINISAGTLSNYVTLKHDGVDCGGASCGFSQTITGTSSFAVVVTATNAGTKPVQGKIIIQATTEGTSGNDTSDTLTINAVAPSPTPKAPTSVNQVTGIVKDVATGQPIGQAEVQMVDSVGTGWSTGSNSKGQFTFSSTETKPIAPGKLYIGATKDGFGNYKHEWTAIAGQNLTGVVLSLSSAATPSAPAASTDAALPSLDASADPGDGLAASQAAASDKGSGGGGFSIILIVLGALLILLGVGAIVLILMRRKDDGTDSEPDGPGPGPGPGPRRAPMPVPPGRGAPYRPGPLDATMVSNANAETTLLRRTPAVDEFPDPYGAPMPPPPRAPRQDYPGQGGGYGQGYPASPYQEPASPYQEPTAPYQAPSSGGGYGGGYQAGGGYGGGYTDPTQPASGSGYRPSAGPPPAPGMPGSPAAPGAPGAPGAPADPYGAPPRGGEYDNRGGYGGGAQYGGQQPPPADPTGRFTNYDQVYDQPRGAERGGYGGGYPPADKPYGGSTDYGATSEYGGGATNDYGSSNGYGAATEYGGGATTEYGGSRGGYGTGQEYQPPAPRGGYEPQTGGYDSPGGYESSPGGYGAAPRGGYGSPDEYPPTAPYDPRTGYDSEYGPGGRSRHSAPPQQPPNYSAPGQDQRPDQRRSLDWLDD